VSGALTELDTIWSVLPSRDKPSSNGKPDTGTANRAGPAAGLPNLNNDDTLIIVINIVGGVVAFIAVLIIVICTIMGLSTTAQ